MYLPHLGDPEAEFTPGHMSGAETKSWCLLQTHTDQSLGKGEAGLQSRRAPCAEAGGQLYPPRCLLQSLGCRL